MQPIKLEIFLDDKTRAGIQSAEGNIGEIQTYTQAVINQLETQLKELQKQFNAAFSKGTNIGRELADIQTLTGAIEQLKAELKQLEIQKKTTNETPVIDMDTVTRQTNSLKMQFTQVARELPSLAMGPQMFILAISNNLPYLADAIKEVRMQNEALSKSGQKGVPVWKQLISAAGSWQMMLVVGITLLTVYGKEIGEWVKGLFKAKDATLELLSAEEEMALSRRKASESIKKEQVELDTLYTRLKNSASYTKERTIAVNEWIKRYPEYANILSGENINLGKLEAAYKALTKEIYNNAVARYYGDKAAEIAVSREKEEIKQMNQKVTLLEAQKRVEKAELNREVAKEANKKGLYGSTNKLAKSNDELADAKKNLTDQQNIYDALVKNVQDYQNQYDTIINRKGKFDFAEQAKEGTYEYWKEQQERSGNVLKNIKSDVKKTLDDASKDGKDLFALGIDKSTVESYKKAVADIKQAKKELKVWDEKDKASSTKTDYQTELAAARIRSQQKVEAARIAVMADGREKRKAIAEQEYKDNLAAIDKEERKILAEMAKERKTGERVTLDDERKVKDDAATQRTFAHVKYDQDITAIDAEWIEKANQSWIEYNKQYGTYQQKKLAITQEYAAKIRKAQKEGDGEYGIMILKEELEKALSGLDIDKLKKEINWELVFSDLSKASKRELDKVKAQLKSFRESPEYRNMSIEQKKIIDESLNDIQSAIVDKGGILGDLPNQLNELRKAHEELKKAQDEYNESLKNGTEEEQEAAKGKLNSAEQNLVGASANVEKSKDKAINNITAIANAISQLGSAGASLSGIGTAVGTLIDVLSQSGSKIGGLIAAILSLLEQVGEVGTLEFAKDLIGNIFESLYESLGKDTQQIVKLHTFGLVDVDLLPDGTAYYEGVKEQLEAINEIYEKIIANSKEDIQFGGGFAAIESAATALDNYYKKVENLKKIADASGRDGAAWNHHSAEWHSNKNVGADNFVRMGELIGKSVRSMDDLYYLSGEELYLIMTQMPEAWSQIDADIRENLESIVACKDEAKELEDTLNQAMTGIDYNSFYNGFITQLSDMDTSFEDMCNNFEDYLRKSIIAGLVSSKYQDRIKDLYEQWSTAAKSDGEITKDEADYLRKQNQRLTEDMKKDIEEWSKDYGWEKGSSSQSGNAGAFTTLTQEQGTKLEGLFTSLQDHASAMHKLMEDLMKGHDADHEIFLQIAENTTYCKLLEDVLELMVRQERDGVKLKN